jgi:nucleotide-binding universal stress UspA family protein
MNAAAPVPGATPGPTLLFERVLVGIDATPESLVAAAQARKVCAPGGRLALVAVAETYLAVHAGMAAPVAGDDMRAGTRVALERARQLVEPDEAILLSGRLIDLLCAECDRSGATLVVVGARPHHRLPALALGGHDVEALHDARCSVLIARPGWGPSRPRRIVVGVDGSPDGHAAEVAARSLAERLGCEVLPVVGLGERDVDVDLLRSEREDALLDPRDLAHAVVAASREDALVVVGRRQAHDHRWGGSVAERIVYAAHCSVLVVRAPGDAATAR